MRIANPAAEPATHVQKPAKQDNRRMLGSPKRRVSTLANHIALVPQAMWRTIIPVHIRIESQAQRQLCVARQSADCLPPSPTIPPAPCRRPPSIPLNKKTPSSRQLSRPADCSCTSPRSKCLNHSPTRAPTVNDPPFRLRGKTNEPLKATGPTFPTLPVGGTLSAKHWP